MLDQTLFGQLVQESLEQLHEGGAFLMTGNPANPMTIGWCQWGRIWNVPICTVFVRKTRHSYELIQNGLFTVSVPALGTMKKELAYCGTHSGRNENKCSTLGLSLLPSTTRGVDALAGCKIHFECQVKFQAESNLDFLDEVFRNQFYSPQKEALPDGNPHTLFFGEVLDAYRS